MTQAVVHSTPKFHRLRSAILSFLPRSESFHDAFLHGLSIVAGGFVGLMIWLAFQPAYHAPVPTTVPTPVVVMVPEEKPAEVLEQPFPEHKQESSTAPTIEFPIPGLSETVPGVGQVPIIRKKDQLSPFNAYRQTFPESLLKKPLVALIALDYGLSKDISEKTLQALPKWTTVLFSPVVQESKTWAKQAAAKEFEVWQELALEPADYPRSDPGANALMTNASLDANQNAIMAQMAASVGYVGFFARQFSPYLLSGADADFLADRVFSRGLGLVLNTDHVDPVVAQAADTRKAPYYNGKMFALDDVVNPAAMTEMLKTAEETARTNGFAIVLFSPNEMSLKLMQTWTTTIDSRGVQIAPLSVLAERGGLLRP